MMGALLRVELETESMGMKWLWGLRVVDLGHSKTASDLVGYGDILASEDR
jgi:hypothetical protein